MYYKFGQNVNFCYATADGRNIPMAFKIASQDVFSLPSMIASREDGGVVDLRPHVRPFLDIRDRE